MRAGYVTLFGMVLAYSAYQGGAHAPTGRTSTAAANRSQDNSKRENAPPFPNTDPLATINAGVCNREIGTRWEDPCDDCGPICPAQDLLDLIQSYFQPDIDESSSKGRAELASWPWRVPPAEVQNMHFVISLLADPVHTHMALFFDRQIEAIEKAAQAQKYFFSRSWMPWDVGTHAEPTDFTVRMSQADVQQRREDIPGLMIFRKSGDKPGEPTSTLFVFVVGETPTGGLHAKQFQNALSIQTSILNSLPGTRSSPLLIFGPTFSGSLQSLYTTLVGYPGKFSKILIRSGTVSSFKAADSFCQNTTPQQWANTKPAISTTPPDFATFQFSDQYEEFYLSTFFADRHQLHSHVAILSEDETQYGNLENHTRASTATGTGNPENQQAQTSAPQEGPCASEPPPTLMSFVHLYFPREIAQLRSAYEQNIKQQPAANSENYVPPQTRLPLSLGVTGNDDDSVPPFATLQTPLSQDAIMQAIVSTLRNEHAKVVVIRASDPLDLVFLARYLRQNYPQARLVTSGADLLMVYDVADPRFHGILAVTSYPLLNGADFPNGLCPVLDGIANCSAPVDDGSRSKDVQRVFSDNFTAGSFNAFLSLLAPGALTAGTGQLPEAHYAQFGVPSFLEDRERWRPHLWLTTVGRDGYWPVSMLDDITREHINDLNSEIRQKKSPFTKAKPGPEMEKAEPTVRHLSGDGKPPQGFSVHFTIGWSIFWLTTVGLTFGFSYLVFFPPARSQRSEVLARFCESCSPSRNWLLVAGAFFLLLIQTLFAFPAIAWLKRFGGSYDFRNLPVFGSTWIVLFGLGYITVVVFLLVLSYKYLTKISRGWRVALAIAVGVAGLLILLFDEIWLIWYFYWLSLFLLPSACREVLGRTEGAKHATLRSFLAAMAATLAIVLPILLLVMTWWLRWESKGNPSEFQSFLYRYIQTGSGVSPLLPLFFILAAWIWWCWQSLTGVVSAENKDITLPPIDKFPKELSAYDSVRLKAVADKSIWTSRVLDAIPGIKRIPILAALGFLCILALMSPSEIAEAFEFMWYRRMYWYVFLYPCLFLICYLAAHIVLLWLHLRDLLRAVERLPFRRGFADVKDLTWKPLWKLAGSGNQDFTKVLTRELSALRQIQMCRLPHPELRAAIDSATRVADIISAAYGRKARLKRLYRLFELLQRSVAITAGQALVYASEKWRREPFSPPEDSSDKDDDKRGPSERPATNPTLRAVEYFLCLFYLNVIIVPLRRLQTLILALAGVFVFVLLSYSSYPFESRESFHALLITILFAISLVVGIVYGQMYSDPLLSRITNTKPGDLGLDFWVKMGSFVFIPVLSLLSVQFPEVNSFLFSWLQPALQSLK
ncbi:MAG TPA: hypothetical protein VGG04_06645 [Candidatus Sulfotelmatobacter sp.]